MQDSGFGFTMGFEPFFGNFDPFAKGFCGVNTCSEPASRQERLSRKLQFMKRRKDDLETKLAGINAMIGSLEQQIAEEGTT